jgi:hypothetical protein
LSEPRGAVLKRCITILFTAFWTFFPFQPASAATINFTVDAGAAVSPIPSETYGANYDVGVTLRLYRQGGNRLTAYNWENNSSNAGTDWYNEMDWAMLAWMNPAPPQNANQQPATAIVQFVQNNNATNADSLITLQMADYVASGSCGPCTITTSAPSDTTYTYWKAVSISGGPSSGAPVTTDHVVYMDQLVHYLVDNLGNASGNGAKFYCLDNEPALWNSTHILAHPAQPTNAEVSGKGISLATVITGIDSNARVLGPVAYGWSEAADNQGAPDASVLGPYDNGNAIPYFNYYLARMNSSSTAAGRRLLHYLDLHWYPEATGGGVRITENNVTQAVAIARMQAPRSLWDPTYTETSWITSYLGEPISLIPRLQSAVSQYYPGTKLAFSEYEYGAGGDVSGGVAQADALGIFGKYGALACRWDDGTNNNYIRTAYNLYLNYDGAGAKFGELSMPVSVPSAGTTLASGYAARSNASPDKIWVIAVSRNYSSAAVTDTGNFSIANLAGGQQISSIRAFRFDTGHSTLYSPTAPSFTANSFSDSLPGRSGTIYEITLNQSFITYTPTPTGTPVFTPTCTPTPTATATGTLATYTYTPTVTLTRTRTLTSTPTVTRTPTPLGCVVLFNGCETPTENGTWSGTNATRSLSTSNATQGTTSLAVNVTTASDWNTEIMNLSGFTPNVWSGVGQVILDVYVSASLLTGSYHQLALQAASASLDQQPITPDYPTIHTGANSVTFNVDFSQGGLSPTDVLTKLYIIYNTDSTGTGIFYLDNIRLNRSPCPITATSTPMASTSPTSSATLTTTLTASHTRTSTRTPTSSLTATPSSSTTPTVSLTANRTASSTPTITLTGTATSTSTVSMTLTASSTASRTGTATPTPTVTSTPSATSTRTWTGTTTPSPTVTLTPVFSFTPSATTTPTATSTSSLTRTSTPTTTSTATSTRTATATSSPTNVATLSATPTGSMTPTVSLTGTPTVTHTVSVTPSRTMSFTPTFSITPTSFPAGTATPSPTRTNTPISTSTPSDHLVLYPNPLLDDSVIGFYYNLDMPADSVKVKIFTVAFRKVLEDAELGAQAGQHYYSFDREKMNSFANGLYFVVVDWNNGGTETRRIMKLLIRR